MITSISSKKICIFIGILSITGIVILIAEYFSEKNMNNQIAASIPIVTSEKNINLTSKKDMSKTAIDLSMEKLNKQLAALQLQINQLKNQRVSNVEDTVSPELTPEEETKIATQAVQEEVELINNTLDLEAVDTAWAEDAHVALTEALQNNERMAGVQLDTVECKSTLCRLSLSFDDQLSLDNGFRTMPSIIPWEGQAFFQVDDVESGEAIVYLAREGHELPNTIE